LEASGLRSDDLGAVGDSDLVFVVKAKTEAAAESALSKVDLLMTRRAESIDDFRPRSLRSALRLLPDAKCVAVSIPGKFAASVAREALDLNRHVFLYSDNVSVQEEAQLKQEAASKGLLVMGPDCGTTILQGVGLGFANRVRRGKIGIVGASGTGIQAISSSIHALGAGISHAIGTGGRDLSVEIGAVTARQALNLLGRDPQTEVIVLVSKPPGATVAVSLLDQARAVGKPVVVAFLGRPVPSERLGNLYFASTLSQAATLAVAALKDAGTAKFDQEVTDSGSPEVVGFVRGLFAGGTLAQEILQGVSSFLYPVHSNLHDSASLALEDPGSSEGHTILDLGDDTYTVGRLHPMIDQDLRLRRLRQEAADPRVSMIILDVVLGDGANPDPAGELAPVIEEILRERTIEFVALVVGTDEDPQDLAAQLHRLREVGARVVVDSSAALQLIEQHFRHAGVPTAAAGSAVDLELLQSPLGVINVGLEMFFDSITVQGFEAIQVDWRPPAGGNERLASLLKRMK
ncbi:MAG: acyl-CoA synthetase FdrA, partial [Thermoanaerobaculia bacterium]